MLFRDMRSIFVTYIYKSIDNNEIFLVYTLCDMECGRLQYD